jgi:hypothetical protein
MLNQRKFEPRISTTASLPCANASRLSQAMMWMAI